MNRVELEKQLTLHFAEIAEMTIDSDIFRGVLPSDKINAVGVIVASQETGNTPSMKKFSAQILGYYGNRDDAGMVIDKLWNTFPQYGKNIIMHSRGSAMIYNSTWNGQDVWAVSINLNVSVH